MGGSSSVRSTHVFLVSLQKVYSSYKAAEYSVQRQIQSTEYCRTFLLPAGPTLTSYSRLMKMTDGYEQHTTEQSPQQPDTGRMCTMQAVITHTV